MLKFCTHFLLTSGYKRVFEILFILFWPRVINEPCFCACVETRSFFILANNFYGSWSSSKFSIFQAKYLVSKKQVFLKNNRAFSKILYGILHYLISITNLSKTSVDRSQFYVNHESHLNVCLVRDQAPLELELRTLRWAMANSDMNTNFLHPFSWYLIKTFTLVHLTLVTH